MDTPSLHLLEDKALLMPTILGYLQRGQCVMYVPAETRSMRTVLGKAVEEELDFVTKNTSVRKDRSKIQYYLELDHKYPVFFGPYSKVLQHLVRMSDSMETLQKMFNLSYIFLTRIHCGWIQ